MKALQIASLALTCLLLLAGGFWFYTEQISNPRVVRELIEEPDGERAHRVMLLSLPGGRRIPVNYIREDQTVYAAADGSWWKLLKGQGAPVELLVRGQALSGQARAVVDDPDYTQRVFAKLRPDALPGFGTLIEIRLEPGSAAGR